MQYFCSQCQRKHNVRDISADIFTLCAEDIIDGINTATNELIGLNTDLEDILLTLQDELVSFLNNYLNSRDSLIAVDRDGFKGDARFNSLFALRGSDIRLLAAKQGVEDARNALTLTVQYEIALETIYNFYLRYSKGSIQQTMDAFNMNKVPNLIKNQTVYRAQLTCEFHPESKDTLRCVYQQNNHDPRGSIRICPHCGRELSYAAGTGEEIVIALAGAPRAGKTSCMVAMLSTLHRGEAVPDFTIEVSTHDRKWLALKQEIDLYRKCYRVTKTEDNILEVPGISLKLKVGQNAFKVITIVDMPGEFWVEKDGKGISQAFFDKYAGLYENIDCIWYAISKATVRLYNNEADCTEEIRAKLDSEFNETMAQIEKADPHVLRENLSALRGYLRSRNKEMPPFLVMLSKPDFFIDSDDIQTTCSNRIYPLIADTLEDICYEAARQTVTQQNTEDLHAVLEENPSRLCESELWCHSYNVRRYIRQTNGAFLRAIEDNCPMHFFVSLSAYGCAAYDPAKGPDAGFGTISVEDGEPDTESRRTPVPYHELYPLIWTLAIHNTLPVAHCITMAKRFMGKVLKDEMQEKAVCFNISDPMSESLPNAGKKQARFAEAREHLVKNLLLHNVTFDTDLRFQKTTFDERMTLRELLVHKRDR